LLQIEERHHTEYNNHEEYKERNEYGEHDEYGEHNKYGEHNEYGEHDEYGEHNKYGERNEYGEHDKNCKILPPKEVCSEIKFTVPKRVPVLRPSTLCRIPRPPKTKKKRRRKDEDPEFIGVIKSDYLRWASKNKSGAI
jgi:hypothetical protein